MKIGKETVFLTLIVLLGVFLRFYKLAEWQFFHFDQARDYTIIKRIVFDQKLTLVGPTVLLPGVYLPPFYYYSLIPFLLIFNFHPLGGDVYTALSGSLAVLAFYFLAKQYFSLKVTLPLLLVFALNPYLIAASRHAWNPNTLPLFVLLLMIFLKRAFTNASNRGYLLPMTIGATFGWCLNLHYTVAVFLPILIYYWFCCLKTTKIKQFLFSSLALVVMLSPLLLFELRHGFSNTRAVANFATTGGSANELTNRIFLVARDLVKIPSFLVSGFGQELNSPVNPQQILLWDNNGLPEKTDWLSWVKMGVSAVLFSVSLVVLLKKRREGLILTLILLGMSIRLVLPATSFYFYHFTFLWPVILLTLGFGLEFVAKKNKRLLAGLTLVLTLSLFPFPLNRVVKTEKFYRKATEVVTNDYHKVTRGKTIAIAANTADHWQHHAPEYRFFLEVQQRLPVGSDKPEDYQVADVLYLVDEGELTDPLKMGGAEMEAFAPQVVAARWVLDDGKKVYRLQR